jgi:hypothetical protein
MAKVYHVLQSPLQVWIIVIVRCFERANPSGKVGCLGKCLIDSKFRALVNSYFAIEDILRVRTANLHILTRVALSTCSRMTSRTSTGMDGTTVFETEKRCRATVAFLNLELDCIDKLIV